MNGIDYYKLAFQRYADFEGRSRRSEYWYFVLFNTLAAYALLFLGGFVNPMAGVALYGVYLLAAIVPSFAVAVRRMHDVGKSGWLLLVSLIPLVGAILLLVWFITDSDPGVNQWGDSPKYSDDRIIEDHLVDDEVV